MDSEAEYLALEKANLSLAEHWAYEWLKLRGTTLWAHHEIQSIDGRITAARWFAREVESYQTYADRERVEATYVQRAMAEQRGFNTDRWDVT